MQLELGKNAKPASGKKIHHSVYRPIGRRHVLLCDSTFNLGIDGWIRNWTKTTRPVTCEHCIRRKEYYENLGRFKENQAPRSQDR